MFFGTLLVLRLCKAGLNATIKVLHIYADPTRPTGNFSHSVLRYSSSLSVQMSSTSLVSVLTFYT